MPVISTADAIRIIQAHAINPDTVRFNPPRAQDMGQILTERLQARLRAKCRPFDPFDSATPSPYASKDTWDCFSELVARDADPAGEFELCGDTTLPIGTRGFVKRMIDRVAGYADLIRSHVAERNDPSWDMIRESQHRADLDKRARADAASPVRAALARLDEGGSIGGGAFPVGISTFGGASEDAMSAAGSEPASVSSGSSGSSKDGGSALARSATSSKRHASVPSVASDPLHGFYPAYTAFNGTADDPRLVEYSMTCSSVEFIGDTECKDTPKGTVTLRVQLRGIGVRPVAVFEDGKLVQLRILAFVLALNAPCASRLRYRYAAGGTTGTSRASKALPGARIRGQRMRGMVVIDAANPDEPLSRVRLECVPVNMRGAPRYIFTVEENGIDRIQTQCLRLRQRAPSSAPGTPRSAAPPQTLGNEPDSEDEDA
jgi:hypothetical protein